MKVKRTKVGSLGRKKFETHLLVLRVFYRLTDFDMNILCLGSVIRLKVMLTLTSLWQVFDFGISVDLG